MNQKTCTPNAGGNSYINTKTFTKASANQMNLFHHNNNALTSSSTLLGGGGCHTADTESINERMQQGKESDLLDDDDDEDSESIVSEAVSMILTNNTNSQLSYQNQVKYGGGSGNGSYTMMGVKQSAEFQRRASVKKQRNMSTSSSIIDQSSLSSSNKNLTSRSNNINQQQLINFDNLLNNKQQLKMHHIEHALASVLDDMKQLDFSTTSNTPNPNPKAITTNHPVIVKSNKVLDNLASSLSSYQTPSTSSSSSTTSSTSSNAGKELSKDGSCRLNGLINNKSEFGENLSQTDSDDELVRVKKLQIMEGSGDTQIRDKVRGDMQISNAVITGPQQTFKTTLIRRPDLVLDLPANLIPCISPPNKNNNNNNPSPIQHFHNKTRRASDNQGLTSSSTSSTDSSSLGMSSASQMASINKRNNFIQKRSASVTTHILNNNNNNNNLLLTSATAAVEEALNASSEPELNAANVVNQSPTLPTTESNTISGASFCLQNSTNHTHDQSSLCEDPNNSKFRNKLDEFKSSNYCSIDEFHLRSLQQIQQEQSENAIEYVELDNEGNMEEQAAYVCPLPPSPPPPPPEALKTHATKKQPPPVMKKPERSEEIMRKFVVGRGHSNDTASSSISLESNVSSANTESGGVQMIRLSSSKATDV